ncbi:MAG: hypothetical protein ACYC7L_06260 [Nitrospirota bacterium]
MDSSIAKEYFEKFRNFVDEFISGDINILDDGIATNTYTLFLLEFPMSLTIITLNGPTSIEVQLFAGINRDEIDNLSFTISPQSLHLTGNHQHCNSLLESNKRSLSSYGTFAAFCLPDVAGEGSEEEANAINKIIDLDYTYRLPSDRWETLTYDQLFSDVKNDLMLFYSVAINDIGIIHSKIK